MDGQPSYFSSATSQLLVLAVALYGIGCLTLFWKGVLTTLEPLQWLINILLPLYAVRKGVEVLKNSNGSPPAGGANA